MRLLCDEDIGTRIPCALGLVGCDATALHSKDLRGRPDADWIPDAAAEGYLVFSSNKRMLLVPAEREAIVNSKLGIVFLTNGEEILRSVLMLLLQRWDWLERIDREPKPFVYFLSPRNRASRRHRLRNGVMLAL